MNRGFPSMTALLGLLAVAGYQNRDKIAEMLGGIGKSAPEGSNQSGVAPGSDGEQGGGDFLGRLATSLGGASVGSILSGGLGQLVDRFRQNGHAETADSWVGAGPNKTITPPQVEQAIGPDVLDDLSRQTGLSREELLARLSRELPTAVDRYTPQGRIPTESEFLRT